MQKIPPPQRAIPQQPARKRCHSISIGRMAVPNLSYPLPYLFPSGKAWAAIKGGVVVNMVYMALPDGVSFSLHRQRSRGALAKQGVVWTGEVINNRFITSAETTDIRHTGGCNTARVLA